ncbi:hypothetical protein JCM9533A_16610 [Catenuloplanes niger JCM 9533]
MGPSDRQPNYASSHPTTSWASVSLPPGLRLVDGFASAGSRRLGALRLHPLPGRPGAAGSCRPAIHPITVSAGSIALINSLISG